MWCKRCGQDVPGKVAPDRTYRCSRCGGAVVAERHASSDEARPAGKGFGSSGEAAHQVPGAESRKVAAGAAAPANDDSGDTFDDWEFAEQLREIGRVLEPLDAAGRTETAKPGPTVPAMRIDRPHAGPSSRHEVPVARRAREEGAAAASAFGAVSWLAISLGTMALVCGGILLGWAVVASREDLWTIGLPIALGGQIGLLVGLLCRIDRIGQEHRSAATRLTEVDQKLQELRSSTTLLATTHSSPATAFYCHLAEGAPPEMLLGDLKGQLDLLAMKLSRESQ